MSDFAKILKAIEESGKYRLSNDCGLNTYNYWEFLDGKEIMIYLGDCSIDIDFDTEGNLIKIY